MTEEFKELYNILSADRADVKKLKDDSEKDLSVLLGRVRSYQVEDINIFREYNLDVDFEKYKIDNIFLNYNIHNDITDFKITILQSYLQDLFVEKKFNQYRKEQEEKLTKNEYLEYTQNPDFKANKISAWYQEFMQR